MPVAEFGGDASLKCRSAVPVTARSGISTVLRREWRKSAWGRGGGATAVAGTIGAARPHRSREQEERAHGHRRNGTSQRHNRVAERGDSPNGFCSSRASLPAPIPDGAYGLFAAPVHDTCQGKTVLVQTREPADPQSGQRCTVNRYQSEKATDEDPWQHSQTRLNPVNADFEPIILTVAHEGSLQATAEVVDVLNTET